MTQYRYIARGRHGKWYPTLSEAQYHVNKIGAGFLEPAGQFVPYRGTVLEFRDDGPGCSNDLNLPADDKHLCTAARQKSVGVLTTQKNTSAQDTRVLISGIGDEETN